MKPQRLIWSLVLLPALLALAGCPQKAFDAEDPDAYAEYWSDPQNRKHSLIYHRTEECYENKDAFCAPD